MGVKIKTINHGIYAGMIQQYIAYKRSLGFKMEDVEERLHRFDTLTLERKESKVGISKALFDAWSCPFPEESACNRYHRISILRGFSAWLQLAGYDSHIPKMPKYNSTFTPHIYTGDEMEAIFRECDKLFLRRTYMYSRVCVMPALIRTLYATGIRIGEAIRLKHKDVDLDQAYLVLRGCKNGRERVVPFSLSLREVLKDYVVYKQSQTAGTGTDDYFFTSPEGRPCHAGTVYEIFRTVLFRAGISHGGRGKGPRLHDLRHTCCLNALVRMSQAGQDLYYSMPVLMTYMGHQSIEATNRYVRLTAEMYPDMLKKVNEAYKYIFPETGIDIDCNDPVKKTKP